MTVVRLPDKQPKYRAKPTFVDGIRFASQKEANRYGVLKLLEKAGKIIRLTLQSKFTLIVNGVKICTYRADFDYIELGKDVADDTWIIEDCKGFKTEIYKLKKRLMKACHGIEIRET